MSTFKGTLSGSEQDVTVNSVHPLPKVADQFVVCNRSNTITIMNIQGQVHTSSVLGRVGIGVKEIMVVGKGFGSGRSWHE